MDEFTVAFIFIIIYTIILFIIRKIGVWEKKQCANCNNCCPDCQSALNRIERKYSDHFINHLSFKIFDPRRYLCSNCGWEGLRWEKKFKPKAN